MAINRRISNSLLAIVFLGCIFSERAVEVRRFLTVLTDVSVAPKAGIVNKYSQGDIEATAPHLEVFHARLLVWSEEEDFRVYNLDHKGTHVQDNAACGRSAKIVPLLVHALKENFPGRFRPGQPVFQLLWSDGDSFQSPCVNKDSNCDTKNFSPFPLFGSVPKDASVLPTVKAFPHWFYIDCLYNWKLGFNEGSECWNEHIDEKIAWGDLDPTVIWRGSDFTFLPTYKAYIPPKLMMDFSNEFEKETMTPEAIVMKLFHYWDELSPRWKAITLSAQAELNNDTWIDIKYAGPVRNDVHKKFISRGVHVAGAHIDAFEMSKYRYQLDLGGGGGTSWRGTLSKLAMPGVLLHHETPTKDWFYDLMKPFQHYIPINLDLADLRGKYDWAEKSEGRAQEIADEGTELAKYIFSEEYMTKIYQELFVDYMGKVVESYIPSNSTWQENYQRYVDHGFTLTQVAFCRATRCFTNVRDDTYRSFPHWVENTEQSNSSLAVVEVAKTSENKELSDSPQDVRATQEADSDKGSKSPPSGITEVHENREDSEQLVSSTEIPVAAASLVATEELPRSIPVMVDEIYANLAPADVVVTNEQPESRAVVIVAAEVAEDTANNLQSIPLEETLVDSILPQEVLVDSILPQETRVDSISSQEARVDSIPSQEVQVDSIPPQETRVDSIQLQEPRADYIPPQETRADSIQLRETRADSIPPQETRVESIQLQETRADSISPPKARVDSIQLQETRADSIPPQETRADSISPQKARVDSIPPQETRADSIQLQETRADSIPPQETRTDSIQLQETRADSIPLQKTRVDSIPLQETRVDSIQLQETRADSIPPQETRADIITDSIPKHDASETQKLGDDTGAQSLASRANTKSS